MRPRFAGVGRAVHAVAVRPVLAKVGLAAAGIDDVRVRRRHGNRADRRDRRRTVRHVLPGDAAVGRLPDTAVHGAEVEHVVLRRVANHGDGATAAERPDEPPSQSAQVARRRRYRDESSKPSGASRDARCARRWRVEPRPTRREARRRVLRLRRGRIGGPWLDGQLWMDRFYRRLPRRAGGMPRSRLAATRRRPVRSRRPSR